MTVHAVYTDDKITYDSETILLQSEFTQVFFESVLFNCTAFVEYDGPL
jgi:hypothetical protein